MFVTIYLFYYYFFVTIFFNLNGWSRELKASNMVDALNVNLHFF